MNNLEKFYRLWKDLDKSFLVMKDSLDVKTKEEFLKKLCYSNDGKTLIIPKIKSILKDELENYSDDEKLQYSELVECLDSVELYLTSNNKINGEIKNLNSLVALALVNKKESTVDKVINEDSLVKDFIIEKNYEKMSLRFMFEKYGEINSFAKIYRNNLVVGVLDTSIESSDCISLNKDSLPIIMKRIKENSPNKVFLEKVVRGMMEIFDERKADEFSLVFFSKDLLSIDKLLGRSLRLNFSGKSFIEFSYNENKVYLV